MWGSPLFYPPHRSFPRNSKKLNDRPTNATNHAKSKESIISETMKVVSIAILRTGPDVAEPIPVSMACELSSYGFFQRQVRSFMATEIFCRCCWHFFLFPRNSYAEVQIVGTEVAMERMRRKPMVRGNAYMCGWMLR